MAAPGGAEAVRSQPAVGQSPFIHPPRSIPRDPLPALRARRQSVHSGVGYALSRLLTCEPWLLLVVEVAHLRALIWIGPVSVSGERGTVTTRSPSSTLASIFVASMPPGRAIERENGPDRRSSRRYAPPSPRSLSL